MKLYTQTGDHGKNSFKYTSHKPSPKLPIITKPIREFLLRTGMQLFTNFLIMGLQEKRFLKSDTLYAESQYFAHIDANDSLCYRLWTP